MTPRAASLCALVFALGRAAPAKAQAQINAADTFRARAQASAEPMAGTSSVVAGEAQTQPGALGDAARALTTLPGVARASFDSGALSVWGMGDADTRVYLDGVELPMLFHPGGFRSTLPDALVSRLTLTKAAPGPELGRNLGANIELETHALDLSAPHAALAIDALDVSGNLKGSVGPLRVAWSGRLGYLHRTASLIAAQPSDNLSLPEYADGFAKAQLNPTAHSQLSVSWLGAHDLYSQKSPASRTLTRSRTLQLVYFRYARRYADRARVTVSPYLQSFEDAQRSRSAGPSWQLRTHSLRYGLRAEYRAELGQLALQLGFDAAALRAQLARSGTLTLPPREGDVSVFGQPLGTELASDAWTTHDAQLAPYGGLHLRFGRWTISPGLRFAVQLLSARRALPNTSAAPAFGRSALPVRAEPRFRVRFYASDRLQLSARGALTHQAAAPEDRSALFGNPALELASGLTAAAGLRVKPVHGLSLELTGFYTRVWQLSARNPARPLPLAAALVPDGRGHNYGAELGLDLKPWHGLSGQLSYTLSRARRQDHASAPERFFDFDQTHIFSLIIRLQLGMWQLGARSRWATGNPRSDVVASYPNLRDDRFEPVFGPHNGARLPDYFSLDLRVERGFTLSGVNICLWLDVLNVTNQRNVEAVAYSFDYRTRQDVTGLPTLAVLGLRAEL